MEVAVRDCGESVFVIGNAPTALEALLDRIDSGDAAPALVIGMPVGFVGASEAKERLQAQSAVPYITVSGRKGGSALAASCLNALAELIRQEREA
jgi:precorrin-8X/cobalt-precorrin-8 methylmutase